MTDAEHLAVCVAMENFTALLADTHCPSRVAIVAMKIFIYLSENSDGKAEEFLARREAAHELIEKLWAETPDQFGGNMGHA